MADLVHRYRPRGACADVFRTRSPAVLLSGPAGTGKSRACLEKLLAAMLKYPMARGLIMRQTQDSLSSTALVTWREHVAPELLLNGTIEYYGGSSEEPPQYRFSNGSKIMIGGMNHPLRIMSSEYDMIYVQEAIELAEAGWEAASTRLRNGRMPYQQLLADTNPDNPFHWLYQRCNRGDVKILESRHTDNPRLFTDDGTITEQGRRYMAVLNRLTGARLLRLRDGKWVASEGQIFDEYDPAVHLVDRFEPPADWPRYWAVDFGFTHAFVWQEWVEDPDGRLILYREIYRTKRRVEEHAEHIMSLVSEPIEGYRHPTDERRRAHHGRRWTSPQPVALICDHDAEGRDVLSVELGMGTTAANKKVLTGLEAVQGRLKPAGDGKPRVLFMRDALVERDPELVEALQPTCTVEEITGYVWADPKKKDQPVKDNDHGCDTMRYVVMDRDHTPEVRVRWG